MDGSSTTRDTSINRVRGVVMHITSSTGRSKVYDPETLSALRTVFDSAWIAIEHNFKPGEREAARLKLGALIFELAAVSAHDFVELRCRAIGAMKVRYAA